MTARQPDAPKSEGTDELVVRAERWLSRLRPCDTAANGPMFTRLLIGRLREARSALSEPAAPTKELWDALELLLDYRRRNGANFQLEKADDFFKRIDKAMDGVRPAPNREDGS